MFHRRYRYIFEIILFLKKSGRLGQMEKDKTFGGDNPKARFGHTITPIGKDRAILFGGAVGDTGSKYVITGDTYLCEYLTKKFKKLENRGIVPTNRAAHASIFIDHYFFVYGGALGGGELADDTLYQVDTLTITDKAFWSGKACNGVSPGARYGHVMAFLKPFLIIYGGNTGNETVGDVWINDIFGSCEWKKADTGQDNPPPRVYHSASICRTGTANGMMVVFGGRGNDNQSLSDAWGLRKHRNNQLDWMRAPYRNNSIKPVERYQHRTMFIGTLLLIIGGRGQQVGQALPLDIYDTDTSEWHRMLTIQRFRHTCFLSEHNIYIHGGFDQVMPNVPTDSILKLDLNKIFAGNHSLVKSLAFEVGQDILTHNIVKKNSNQYNNPDDRKDYPATHHGRRSENKMDIQYSQPIKRNIHTTNKPIRLCQEAIVANYDDHNEVKKIGIQELQAEHRKLNENSLNSLSISRKDPNFDHISRYFLSSLFLQPNPMNPNANSDYLDKMFNRLEKILEQEPTLIKIRAPVKVFGDVHGQIGELNRAFEQFGAPTDEGFKGDIQSTNYLFLGDYVDRGTKSVETILLLFALKLKYPENFILLRGSHEDRSINRSMGFGDECATKFKENIDDPVSFFQKCNRLFDKLPLAALIDDSILCVHGGIGITLKSINEIAGIERPLKVNHDPKSRQEKIIYELLWSDPYRGNQQGNYVHSYFNKKSNVKFTDQRADDFCTQNELLIIIRSGEPFLEGFEARQSSISVFSCSDYGGSGNKLSIAMVKKNQQIDPMILNPTTGRNRWITDQDFKRKPINAEDSLLRSISFTPPK